MWDRMPAVGREFGSPDFDRLMEEDYRLHQGIFDPALAADIKKRTAVFAKRKLLVPPTPGATLPHDVPADSLGFAGFDLRDDRRLQPRAPLLSLR